MKRGRIYWINLEDSVPPEMGKTRPGIIVSNDQHNGVLNTVVVIPLSTREPEIWPIRLRLPKVDGMRKSFAITAGIRQVNKERILKEIGGVPESFMQHLEAAYSAYLGE